MADNGRRYRMEPSAAATRRTQIRLIIEALLEIVDKREGVDWPFERLGGYWIREGACGPSCSQVDRAKLVSDDSEDFKAFCFQNPDRIKGNKKPCEHCDR